MARLLTRTALATIPPSRPLSLPRQTLCPETRHVPGMAVVRSATRRIMSVTFADGRELVRAQCLERGVFFFTHPAPELLWQLFPGGTLSLFVMREGSVEIGASRRA
jgi:hypothetical protein